MNSEAHRPAPSVCRSVLLIHGLGSHRVFMWPIVWYLNRNGFVATTFGYRSFTRSIEHHAELLCEELDRLQADPEIDSFAIVGHSMGGIVTRQALLSSGASERFSKLKRVVQLGSPNHGSWAAKLVGNLFWFLKTFRQISNHPDSFVNRLPCPGSEVEFGIIAGSYDYVVSRKSSHLPNEKDHITIFGGHNGLLVRPRALKQVREFLINGKFAK